jgi:hypothetical protein
MKLFAAGLLTDNEEELQQNSENYILLAEAQKENADLVTGDIIEEPVESIEFGSHRSSTSKASYTPKSTRS